VNLIWRTSPDLQTWGLGSNPVGFVLLSTCVKIFLTLSVAVMPAPLPAFAECLEFTV